jgi:hypothetical protein
VGFGDFGRSCHVRPVTSWPGSTAMGVALNALWLSG